jgi:hypothetical protein
VKGILGNSSLVKCYENETCKHPRKGWQRSLLYP